MATKAKTRKAPATPSRSATVASPGRKVEWVAAALSACLFGALVIYLAVLGFSSRPAYADFEVTQSRAYDNGGAIHIDVAVRNTGSKSAADVLVIARLDGEEVGEIIFDYVPSGSTRQGTVRLAGGVEPTIRLDIAVAAFREP